MTCSMSWFAHEEHDLDELQYKDATLVVCVFFFPPTIPCVLPKHVVGLGIHSFEPTRIPLFRQTGFGCTFAFV